MHVLCAQGFEAKGKVLVVADVHGGEASDNEVMHVGVS